MLPKNKIDIIALGTRYGFQTTNTNTLCDQLVHVRESFAEILQIAEAPVIPVFMWDPVGQIPMLRPVVLDNGIVCDLSEISNHESVYARRDIRTEVIIDIYLSQKVQPPNFQGLCSTDLC